MSCRGFVQVLLKVLNFVLTLVGLAMIGYGIYMLVRWENTKHTTVPSSPPPPSVSVAPTSLEITSLQHSTVMNLSSLPALSVASESLTIKRRKGGLEEVGINALRLRRALLLGMPIQKGVPSLFKHLPSSWFIYLFIAVGVIICLITCSGYIAAATTNGCCLCCYTVFTGLFIILELAVAGFIFFNHHWQENIPDDPTGQFDNIENFIKQKFNICKWVALAAMIVQAFALLLSIVLRAMGSSRRIEYDSDDEYLAPRSSVRQPLLNRQGVAGAAVAPAPSEPRAGRTDAWSTRMREKYGLDTTEFTYNPTESKRFTPQTVPPEEKSSCSIM